MNVKARFGLFVTLIIAPGAWAAPPIAVGDTYVTTVNTTLTVSAATGLLLNDSDPDGDAITASNFFAPDHGELTSIVTSGAFTYAPPTDFTGVATFTYRDHAGTDYSEYAPVTIYVLPDSNRPPTTVPDVYWTSMNTTLSVSAPGLLRNDYDADGDTITATNYFAPDVGTLTSIVTNGSFVYVPETGFTGVATFRYRTRDSHFESSAYVPVVILVGLDFGAELLDNGSFEVPREGNAKLPQSWKARRISGDKLVSNVLDPNQPEVIEAFHGARAFRFNGSANENSKLIQKIKLPGLAASDELRLIAFAKGEDATAGLKITAIAKYTGGGKEKFVLTVDAGTYDYMPLASSKVVLTDTVDKIIVTINNRMPSGSITLDKVCVVKNGDISPFK